MFIPDRNCPTRILTVLKLSWDKAVRTTGPRAFHALSFKLEGGSVYMHEGRELARAETGDVLFCPKGVGYTQRHDKSTVIVVHFDCPGDEIPCEFEVFKVPDPQLFADLFNLIYTQWNSKEKGCEYRAAATFNEILFNLKQLSPIQDAGRMTDLDSIIQFIDQNLGDAELAVSDIASRYGCSASYLRRLFLREKGLSPKQYITQMRLSQAKSLLATGYFNVTETALKCGFASQKHFSTMFLANCGLTPSDYIKAHNSTQAEP